MFKEDPMLAHRLRHASCRWITSSATLLSLLVVAHPGYGQKCCPPALTVPPCPQPTAPAQPPDTTTPRPETPTPAPEPALSPEAFAATDGGETFAGYAPNVIGDLLNSSRSISFSAVRTGSNINLTGDFGTTAISPNIADNNSPMPRDRIAFRYNHYNDSQTVTGFSETGGMAFPASQTYSVDQYTFTIEKAFLNGWMSFQFDLPFASGLSTNNVWSAGKVTGFTGATDAGGRPIFTGVDTPQNTLGKYASQFGNIELIWKSKLIDRRNWLISGGAALTIPTAPNTNLQVIDFGGNPTSLNSVQRVRNFFVDNNTWVATPFLAGLWRPTPRWFNQGFFSIEFPLNDNQVRFNEYAAVGGFSGTPGINPQAPFNFQTSIAEQPLLHLDYSTGFWLVRDSDRKWLTGFAPLAELHYTDTIRGANVVTLPSDGSNVVLAPGTAPVPAAPPQIGNLTNRVNYLDATMGCTFVLADRATLSVGCALPLLTGTNRAFDWEAQVLVNWYFGAGSPRMAGFTPSLAR
jgi:hypothetical protein